MRTYRILLVTAGVSILAACGGGGGGSVDTGGMLPTIQGSVSGTATKGPMNGATVAAYAIGNAQVGAQIATATTDATGHFTLLVGGYAGPMLLQITGGTFTDEATGQTVSFGPGDMMTALVPTMTAGANVSGIQVTPVTAMAQSMAQHMTGGMTDANIAAANKAMGTYFSINDILHTAPMNPLTPGSGTGASQDAQNYGMVMAAMSQYAQSQGLISPTAVVTAMMNDASDGVMDGMMAGGGRVMMGGGMAMSATAGTSGLGGAMNTFMNSAQNKSGVVTTTLMNMLSGSGSTTTPPATNPPPMMNGTVSGTVFDGTMNKATVSAYAINNGAMGAMIATVSTDNQGNFTLPVGTYAGTMMLQVSGGTYADEATGTTMIMGTNDVMTAVMPAMTAGANVSGIWVTPISSLAQSRALGMSGGMTDANIAAANGAVGNYFMMSDILHTQPLNPAIPGSGAAASPDARNCGAVLAAISQSAKDQGIPVSSTLVTAMMSDAWDGAMNGMHGSSAVSMSMGGGMMGGGSGSRSMMTTTGTSGLATAMQEFMNSAVNASGLTVADMAALMTKLTNSSGQI